MAFMLMFFAACSSDNQIFPEEIPTVETPLIQLKMETREKWLFPQNSRQVQSFL